MDDPPIEDVTDLDKARRIIAPLRREVARLRDARPLDNEVGIGVSGPI